MDRAGIDYSIDCPAAGLDLMLPDRPGLPEAAAETRRALFDAALARDWEILAGVPGEGSVAAWRRSEMLPFAPTARVTLALTLTAPWAAVEDEDGTIATYAWPSAAVADGWNAIPPEERAALSASTGTTSWRSGSVRWGSMTPGCSSTPMGSGGGCSAAHDADLNPRPGREVPPGP
jgi:hypothetical protein